MLDDLIALGKYRWAVPLLTDLAARGGARFVELLHRLQIPRESLSRTLEGAAAMGWIMRNPGHGHPLRPEYVLTAGGRRLATKAAEINAVQRRLGIVPSAMTRWSLPIIRSVADGNLRFNDLARAIPPVGPRALSQGLRTLTGQLLISRELLDLYPPSSQYSLTKTGLILAEAA